MTKGLIKSSLTSNKLYRKCISKPTKHPAHIRYAKYRNIYNKVKQNAKSTYYDNQLNTFKNDSKQTWNLLKNMIEKTMINLAFPYISNIIML